MGIQRIIILGFGAVGMLLLMLLRRNKYPHIPLWKYPVISLVLTICGVAGAMLMHRIESGSFNGTSFFGAILFVPVLMLPALALRVSFDDLMDLSAPAECLMLMFMKLDCQLNGCCYGKFLPALGFQFPSQIVEIFVAFFLMLALLRQEKKSPVGGTLYGWYLILYGAVRFVLNWFRYGVKPFVWILPAGNFWSLAAIALGLVWLYLIRRKTSK